MFWKTLEWSLTLFMVIPAALQLACGFLLEFVKAPRRTIRALQRAPWRENAASVIEGFSVDLRFLDEKRTK